MVLIWIDIIKELKEYWDKLCKSRSVSAKLCFITSGDFMKQHMSDVLNEIGELQKDIPYNEIPYNEILYNIKYDIDVIYKSPTRTVATWISHDNKMMIDSVHTFLFEDYIIKLIMCNIEHIQDVEDYLKLLLEYEFGIIQDSYRMIDMNESEFAKILKVNQGRLCVGSMVGVTIQDINNAKEKCSFTTPWEYLTKEC